MINPVRAARAAFCLTAATGLHRRTAAFYTTLGLGTTGALRTSLVGATRIMSTTAGGASDGQPAQECVYQDGKAFRLQVRGRSSKRTFGLIYWIGRIIHHGPKGQPTPSYHF